jgi:hypothetical protein
MLKIIASIIGIILVSSNQEDFTDGEIKQDLKIIK